MFGFFSNLNLKIHNSLGLKFLFTWAILRIFTKELVTKNMYVIRIPNLKIRIYMNVKRTNTCFCTVALLALLVRSTLVQKTLI